MKKYSICIALLLAACSGFTKEEFLQDTENQNKYEELSAKHEKTSDCDKLEKLYNFTQIDSPTIDDLGQILPLLGLTTKDAKDIDKVYNINYSIVDKYNCEDNAEQLLHERTQYCKDKYYDESLLESVLYLPYRTAATITFLPSVISPILGIGALPFFIASCKKSDNADFVDTFYHPVQCQKKLDCEKYLIDYNNYTDTEDLKNDLEEKVKSVFPEIESKEEYLLQEFKRSELIRAKQTVIGNYDKKSTYGDFYCGNFCDRESGQVTKLNVAMILHDFCLRQLFLPSDDDDKKCICYAHSAYNTMTYKNILYIYEQNKLPQSKQYEFRQMFNKCEQKIKQQQINANKNRYGEAVYTGTSNALFNDDIVDTVVDAVTKYHVGNKKNK